MAPSTGLTFDGARVTGLRYIQKGREVTVHAAREVVLSGGTVNSPQMLMVSGIGPAAHLASHGIAVRVDLPGVGQNLQDHVDCVMSWECPQPITLYRDLRADRLTLSMLQGMLFGSGIVTTFPYEAGAFLRTHAALEAPDVQLHFMPALEKTANLNFPNPFRDHTVIRFSTTGGMVQILLYDEMGRMLRVLYENDLPAGTFDVGVDRNGLPAGNYFYQIHVGSQKMTKKMVIVG